METRPITPTEAHYALRRDVIFSAPDDGAQLIADSEARATAELRGALALGQQNCNDVFEDLRDERDQLRAEAQQAHVTRDATCIKLAGELREARAELEQRRKAMADTVRELGEGCCGLLHEEIAPKVKSTIARAERAEAELAFQVARNSDLFTQRDEAVEAQEKAEAELAKERARLDWLWDERIYSFHLPKSVR